MASLRVSINKFEISRYMELGRCFLQSRNLAYWIVLIEEYGIYIRKVIGLMVH
jgi:hypothetical protein